METTIVVIILAAAMLWAGRGVYRTLTGKSTGCCGKCSECPTCSGEGEEP